VGDLVIAIYAGGGFRFNSIGLNSIQMVFIWATRIGLLTA